MLNRERSNGPVPDPQWQSMTTEEGMPFWVCAETGDFTVQPPAQPQDFKGGFFCDEPGDDLGACCALLITCIVSMQSGVLAAHYLHA